MYALTSPFVDHFFKVSKFDALCLKSINIFLLKPNDKMFALFTLHTEMKKKKIIVPQVDYEY